MLRACYTAPVVDAVHNRTAPDFESLSQEAVASVRSSIWDDAVAAVDSVLAASYWRVACSLNVIADVLSGCAVVPGDCEIWREIAWLF